MNRPYKIEHNPMKKIEFFYDIVSPYSYIAATQMAQFEGKADVVWRPVLLVAFLKRLVQMSILK